MWYLHQFKKDENDNLNGWWEEGKTRIKEISLNFSNRKSRENKNYKFNLRKQFRNVKNKLDRDPSNTNSKYLYNKINHWKLSKLKSSKKREQKFAPKRNGERTVRPLRDISALLRKNEERRNQ